ncbi:hypothetical protein [Laspinema olomoucense]|uniref:hypothetical protein n=1 Tax=Laspinema olomoucense TaxID=3231600 RepID=UPI0021BA5D94|nr:hypothetical protein [Laspinema sp. D3c]MCT7990394.1 hypothetical protein [Laspinema sp. D3a]MCT7994854.1 hypothetical protein [Laspinema sp. D3c]
MSEGSLVIGHWSFVIGHWSLVIGHWSLGDGGWGMGDGGDVCSNDLLLLSLAVFAITFEPSGIASN